MSIKYSALITFATIFVLMIGVLIGYTVTFSFTTEKIIEVPVITETFIEVLSKSQSSMKVTISLRFICRCLLY